MKHKGQTGEHATKRQCREMVELMILDREIGISSGGAIYSVKGTTGKYLIVQKQRPSELFADRTIREVSTVYKTDFVDLIYENLKGAKVVKI